MQAKLLTMGTASQNSNGRWNASVWYLDENGERKRKAFSGKTCTANTKAKCKTGFSTDTGS